MGRRGKLELAGEGDALRWEQFRTLCRLVLDQQERIAALEKKAGKDK